MDIKDVCFIRGLSREIRHWGDFPQTFAKTFSVNVHCLELPGVGHRVKEKSPKSISQITDQVRDFYALKTPFSIVSISMGGMISLDWLNRFPDEVQKVCIINSSAGNLSLPYERLRWDAIKTIAKLFVTKDVAKREEEILKLTCNLKEITPELLRNYTSFAAQYPISKETFLKQIFAASTFKIPSNLPSEKLHVISSDQDRLVNPKCSEKISQFVHCPHSRHKKAGHDLVLDDPAWLMRFFKENWF